MTGGIASGKTTVSDCFSNLGVPIIDCDIITREITQANKPAYHEIIDLFGTDIIDNNGMLNRKKLSEIIFNNQEKKKALENILHPLVFEEIDRRSVMLDFPYCIVVIPLLVETNTMDKFDRILVVDTPYETQLDRLMNRDSHSDEAARNIISTQINREQRNKFADDVIDNSISIDLLHDKIKKLHNSYLAMATSPE